MVSSPILLRQACAQGADHPQTKDALRGRVQALVALVAAAFAAAALAGRDLSVDDGHEAPTALSRLGACLLPWQPGGSPGYSPGTSELAVDFHEPEKKRKVNFHC